VQVNLGKLGLVESVGILNQANFNKNLHIERGNLSMSKKAFKVASAAAVAASAFVAVNPAQAATAAEAEVLVKKAESLGGTLKWAISVEGSWDGHSNPDMKLFNDAKAAHAKALTAVSSLPAGSQKTALQTRLNDKVKLYVDRAVTVIDAVSAGKKIEAKKEALETLLDANQIGDATEAAYHGLSKEIRKQEVLLSRVYGKSSRDAIRGYYQAPAEKVAEEALYPVSVKIELDRFQSAIGANYEAEATKRYEIINAWLPKVENAALKSALQNRFDSLKASYDNILALKVESVMALNSKEFQVKFNRSVDEVSATDLSNYIVSINGTKYETVSALNGLLFDGADADSLPDVVFNEDNNTVTFKLNNANVLANGAKYSIDVRDGVLLADKSKNLTRYTDTVKTFSDTAAPKLVKSGLVSTATGKKLKLTFDKPVAGHTDFKATIDGQPVTLGTPSTEVGDYSVLSSADVATSLTSVGTHNVSVYETRDLTAPNFNKASILTGSYTVGTDTVAPAVKELKQVSGNSRAFDIHFTEGVSVDLSKIVVKKGAYKFAQGAGPISNNTTFTTSQIDGDTVRVTFSADSATPINTLYNSNENTVDLSVEVDGFKDAVDLVGAKYTGSLTLNKDLNAPVVESKYTNYIDGTLNGNATDTNGKLVVDFNKTLDVTDGTAVDVKKITVTDKAGVTRTVTGATIVGDKVELTIADLTDRDDLEGKAAYTVNFAASAVKATNGVWNAALSTEVLPTSSVVAPVAEAVTNVAVNSNVITVTYNQAMGTSAVALANYTLDNATFPAGTTISMNGTNNVVSITLPAGYTNVGITKLFTISKDVKTANGSTVVKSIATKEAYSETLNFADNTKPSLVSAKYFVNNVDTATVSKRIKLTFSENVAVPTGSLDDLKVMVNGSVQSVASIEDGTAGDKVVTLVLVNDVNLSQASTISVDTSKTLNIADLTGNTVASGSVTTAGVEKE
jgi:SbsC C-terminal domain